MKWLGLLGAVLALSGCNYNLLKGCLDEYVRPDWARLRQEMEQNHQLWQSKNIQSYSYTWRLTSWIGPQVVEVRVENGAVVSAKNLEGQTSQPDNLQEWNLNRRFEQIDQISQSPGPCTTLWVEYDPAYGFPRDFGVGQLERGLADGAGGYQISNFTLLP